METLGNRLRMFRNEKHMTLDDVAKAIGVSRQTIQRYETGVIPNIPPDKIPKLASLFNTTTDYLITGENTVTSDPEFHMLQRTYEKMSSKDKKNLMIILRASFNKYFDDNIDDNEQHKE